MVFKASFSSSMEEDLLHTFLSSSVEEGWLQAFLSSSMEEEEEWSTEEECLLRPSSARHLWKRTASREEED